MTILNKLFDNELNENLTIRKNGCRYLSCKNKEYTIKPGDLLLFNSRDNHTCKQIDGKALDYRCINIQPEIMSKAVFEITGRDYLPCFKTPVVFHSEMISILRELHLAIILLQS